MGHTGALDGAVEVEVEVAVGAAPVTTTVVDADAKVCPVAVDPVARIAGGVVVVVAVPGAGAFSFCARLVALPKPRNLPIIPPPGVPGVVTPFPAVLSLLPPAPVFALVPDLLSSGVAGAAAA